MSNYIYEEQNYIGIVKILKNIKLNRPIDAQFVVRVLNEQQSEQFLTNILKSTPMGRMGSPDEVAKSRFISCIR